MQFYVVTFAYLREIILRAGPRRSFKLIIASRSFECINDLLIDAPWLQFLHVLQIEASTTSTLEATKNVGSDVYAKITFLKLFRLRNLPLLC